MTAIILTIVFSLLAAYAVGTYVLSPAVKLGKKTNPNALYIIFTVALAFVLRVVLSAVYMGHSTDMGCFIAWSDAVFKNGFSGFYKLDMFHDYPPGYMYVLYAIGAVQNLFKFSGGALWALIKLPAVVCDILTAVFVYKISKKRFSDAVSTVIAALYLFNPAAILNCSLWGQVDSVYTIFALIMIYCIAEKKILYSYFAFALCLFIKPQAFIFAPVLIGGIIENVFLDNFSRKKFLINLGAGAGTVAALFIVSLPFGISNVIEQYKATVASYPYYTVNAFNIWGALGKNWAGLTPLASILGYLFIAAATIYSLCVILKGCDKSKYYVSGALLAFLTYMTSVKMHDRYAFPAIALTLFAFAAAPTVKNYAAYVLVSISQFFNTAWVLFIYSEDPNAYYRSPAVIIASIINILIAVFLVYSVHTQYAKKVLSADAPKVKPAQAQSASENKKKTSFSLSDRFPKINRADIIAMVLITAVYSAVALVNLGDTHAPESEYMLSDGDVTIDLGSDYDIRQYKFYLGSYEMGSNRDISLRFENSDHITTFTETMTSGSVFCWEEYNVNAVARYVALSTNGDKLSIKEFAFLGINGDLITPVSVSQPAAATLFDEQDEVPERSTFRNSTYFDEIYHARTAYEFVHGLSVYEWTHPPLGKAFIAAGVKLFGMCPFGWRIAGTVFGIFMIPIIYLFALKLLKKSWLAIVTCLLFTFDFMHFAQTRIATIDVYVTFFIMLMYMFMYKYYSTSFYDSSFKKGLTSLALCGISMGLGIACKWTGIYAGAGLFILFCISVCKRYNEYRHAVSDPSGTTDGISHSYIARNFKPYMIKTVIWCCIFFIAIPLLIYCVSYIPYLNAPDQSGISSIISNQHSMFTYHSKTVLGSEHPYSSRWFEWIIMKRPIWYYSGELPNGLKEGISSFGNPLVWWLGIPAFFYMLWRVFRNRDKNALFLTIAYLAQLVSWIPVTRLTFIYHYFPCVPFITLMLGYSILCIYNESKNKKAVMYGAFAYAGLAIALFAMFYPVLSGAPCSIEYAENFLKWFNSWVLL